ncbi:rab11 family-interacting protein 1 isoform X1 [Balaenoptera ricei]|uniref:rab11 family-interacting protein 1 isoform X1 n=1 Tax=Balaenoptera ricei TaxID=2746895 RepID=UPI0028BEB0F2|nr:rab11 family-interacting protein 1 isoform X1 [Balaenoptera ricei]XP_059765289.1 rab11 family-interacting protein 1 isoform X1 [Balaenoptera ricei]XP_059765290.1 rab11 family-interacting protein 1 isoform X1 [Balaenoptera ricei]
MSLAASAGRGPGAVWSPTHVQVTVLQARGLRAKGPGGTSDAYAVIQVGKEKYATSVSERSLGAPVWREEATFELPPLLSAEAASAAAATLQLTVLHRALLGLDKFLGRAEVDLRELHRDQGHRKTQWYTLKSKPGKKNKERGEIEVDIQFMRNNMTASMFDLSMKDKSRNPFGKLKDKIKGKNKDSASDTVSAIIPSVTPSADSDEESPSKDKKKKSKLKTLFSRSNLQRTSLSQSMSVLPTAKSDKVLLRPGDFQSQWEDEENDEDKSSSASDALSHKGTASVDPKQLNQINFNPPKKEGLSFLGGLRSKNDILSRSNVCINGNHVYVEQPEAKSETKDSSPSSTPSPQGLRKKHLFSSTENLASRPLKEPGEGGAVPSESSTKDSLKSMSLPSYQPRVSGGDLRENTVLVTLEAAKETKESKKQENKKSSLLSLVTGKKDTAKGREGESPPATPGKEREGTPVVVKAREDQAGPLDDRVKRSDKETAAIVSGRGRAPNPFEDVQIPEQEADPEPKAAPAPPVPSPRAPQTRAVKPRLEVSPEAQPAPRLPPSTRSPVVFSALPSSSGQTPVPSKLGRDSETQSSESPSGSFSFPSPEAAPISTSTPIEHWPSADVGEASPKEPPSLLEPELEQESLTQVPSTVPCAVGSLSKQTPVPVGKGTEDSPVGKTGADDPGQSLRTQPEVGREEELLGSPPRKQQGAIPSSVEAREVTPATALGRGGMDSPAGKPPGRGASGSAGQSRSPVGDAGGGGGMSPAVKEAVPPVPVGESVPPLDSAMQSHEEMGPDACEGREEIQEQVLFSEQLSTEGAGEKAPVLVRGDRGDPQELTPQGAAPGNAWDTGDSQEGAAVAGPRPAAPAARPPRPSSKGSCSGGPAHAASSGRDGPLLGSQGDDAPMARNQSKASDHEGLLSDPLHGLQSACEAKPPALAHLDLTLPSIPEVASEDERGDQLEDDRGVAPVAALGGGASSPSTWPARAEREGAPSGEAGGSAGGLRDPRPGAPRAPAPASAEQTTASAVQEPQSPGPGDSGEAKPVGDGRPGQPPAAALDSLVSTPPFSEPFPATRSFPTSARSDTHHTSTAESQKKAAVEGSAGKVENSGKRKPLLQAWVSPSDTQPVSAQPSAGSGSAKHRLHPVKPMNAAATKVALSSSGTATVISENLVNEAMMKKYKPSEPEFAYAQLTHDELIQLVLKQKEAISKKECQVRQLEDYIDNLLVRVMEETPSILRVPSQVGRKAGKM